MQIYIFVQPNPNPFLHKYIVYSFWNIQSYINIKMQAMPQALSSLSSFQLKEKLYYLLHIQ